MLSVLVALLLTAAPLSAQPVGALVGCVTDMVQQHTEQHRLPGVTVVARTLGASHTTVADAGGCYEFRSLPSNVYRVTVRLTGFDNETQEHVSIEPGDMARVDFQMRISTICECLAEPTTLAELWKRADSVVHLRIIDLNVQPPALRGSFVHQAAVLEVLKRHPDGGPADAAIAFLQSQSSGEPDPYYFGDELVIFLKWSAVDRSFYMHTHSPWAIPVQDGGIVSFSPGMRVDDFLAELRALPAGQ